MTDLPEAERDDPWALLNAGFYRDARRLFAADAHSPAAARTGAALAAAMTGDLAAAADLMPADPALPAGVTLSDATAARLRQFQAFFFQDDPAMQQALTTLLTASVPAPSK